MGLERNKKVTSVAEAHSVYGAGGNRNKGYVGCRDGFGSVQVMVRTLDFLSNGVGSNTEPF